MQNLFTSLSTFITETIITKSIQTIVIVSIIIVIQQLSKKAINRFINSHGLKYRWRKASKYLALLFSVLLIAPIWIKSIHTVATFLGLFTAGLAISLKDSISNIAAWIYILVYSPFKLSDRIEINSMKGDVIDIDMFQISMLEIGAWADSDQSTGRIVHIPTSFVFSHSLFNYSKGFNWIWNEVNVLITFESNWQKAKTTLEKIVNDYEKQNIDALKQSMNEAKKEFLVSYEKIDPIVYLSVKESGVNFTIRYFCEPRKRRGSEHFIWNEVLSEFNKQKDIQFAYPTTRFYDRQSEHSKQQNQKTEIN